MTVALPERGLAELLGAEATGMNHDVSKALAMFHLSVKVPALGNTVQDAA